MRLDKNISLANGLPAKERETMARLIEIYNEHESKNRLKRRYYEGHVTLNEVNLGLALPKGMQGLEIGCAWGEKAVDVLASRSMFDGFVGQNGEDADAMNQILRANRLVAEYNKACRDELKYGCAFAALYRGEVGGCHIRFYSPEAAAGEWNGERGRIGAGFVVVATGTDAVSRERRPQVIHLHTDTDVWELRAERNGTNWAARRLPHMMGRPMMEPLIWNATSAKPFGRSRIKEPIRRLIQGYVRTVANATIGLEFSTSPQKYLLGVTDDQYDAIVDEKFKAYVGSILASTTNTDTGENPVFGQLPQGTIEPHVQQMRLLATQFSAATGLTVTDVGVVNDANPTSSDAILAQSQTLILLAEQLNTGNGDSLHTIALMAQAIARNVTLDELTEEEQAVAAHFKNPAMPSIAAMADAAIKIASNRAGFAGTDVYLEMVGFDQADIRRIKAQETRERGRRLLTEEFNNADLTE